MLDDNISSLARGKNFAVIVTLGDEGEPMAQPMWVDTDGEQLLINTEVHRKKFRNMQKDPRVVVTIFDMENPYSYGEVRGRVTETVTGPEALDHINQLAMKYMNQDKYPLPIESERVIVKIAPERQLGG